LFCIAVLLELAKYFWIVACISDAADFGYGYRANHPLNLI
jgi:hypothetical protein